MRSVLKLARSDSRFQALLERFDPGVDGALITYTNALRAELRVVRRFGASTIDQLPVDPSSSNWAARWATTKLRI